MTTLSYSDYDRRAKEMVKNPAKYREDARREALAMVRAERAERERRALEAALRQK